MLTDETENYINDIYSDELVKKTVRSRNKSGRFFVRVVLFMFFCFGITKFYMVNTPISKNDSGDIMYSQALGESIAKTEILNIPTQVVNKNPFLPYRNLGPTDYNKIPEDLLVAPPEVLEEASSAAKIMDTTISGILYDKYNSSAIINIEGTDYFVKKGDVINNYKILDIKKDSVMVKLDGNIYTAGIGEILTEGTITHNNVSNLNKKFGGDK